MTWQMKILLPVILCREETDINFIKHEFLYDHKDLEDKK